jgi:hypothetical protein
MFIFAEGLFISLRGASRQSYEQARHEKVRQHGSMLPGNCFNEAREISKISIKVTNISIRA